VYAHIQLGIHMVEPRACIL